MGLWERLLFGREAEKRAREASERWEEANKGFDAERLKFHEARGRVLAAAERDKDSCRPMTLPDAEEIERE